MNLHWARDGAFDPVPCDIDDTFALLGQLGEGVLIQIEVVGPTARALIGHLSRSASNTEVSRASLTIAVMLFPLGPVTLTHPPQDVASSQLESLKAVP